MYLNGNIYYISTLFYFLNRNIWAAGKLICISIYPNKYNILYTKSAFKHGYSQEDIVRAIETRIYEDLLKGEDGIYIIIGFDTSANPIEVFYNMIDNETIKVFHVMALREKIEAQIYE